MKITKTKKSIALKISKSVGAWPHNGKWAVQNRDGEILISGGQHVPVRRVGKGEWELDDPISSAGTFNLDDSWFQCILSRDEYFHLYPAPDADGWIEWNGGECPVRMNMVDVKFRQGSANNQKSHTLDWSINGDNDTGDIIAYRLHKPVAEVEAPKPERIVIEPATTIEQLAAEYRNRQDYAKRKQQEADEAKAEAEAKLAELVAAGKVVGLVVSVAAPEPELIITDIDGLIEGDVIELTAGERYNKTECTMVHIDGVGLRAKSASDTMNKWWNLDGPQDYEWRFLRRPSREATNA